jgi:hypothetical protein
MKSKSHNHYANQTGLQSKPKAKPSPSTVNKVGVTAPIQKPSKSTMTSVGVTPPKVGAVSPKKGSKC